MTEGVTNTTQLHHFHGLQRLAECQQQLTNVFCKAVSALSHSLPAPAQGWKGEIAASELLAMPSAVLHPTADLLTVTQFDRGAETWQSFAQTASKADVTVMLTVLETVL